LFWLDKIKVSQINKITTESMTQSPKNYHQQKKDFLDSLQPDDLRNGESFNQLEKIIDSINQACLKAVINQENSNEFITKALKNLFRENSPAIEKATELAETYLKNKIVDFDGFKKKI